MNPPFGKHTSAGICVQIPQTYPAAVLQTSSTSWNSSLALARSLFGGAPQSLQASLDTVNSPPEVLQPLIVPEAILGLVTTTILSITAPGPGIERDAAKAAALARSCNESAAAIRNAQPLQYGFFASVPSLFDTAAVLKEIDYACTSLRADGVTLFTRYGDGPNYLGHAAFRPVWADLSRRGAVVFIHPTHPVDTQLVNQWLPQPMFDYPHETGRAAMDLLTSGILQDYPGCKIILSHAGGTLPYLIHRAATMLPFMPRTLAISSNPVTLKALFEFAAPGHVLFGSDFPNAPHDAIQRFTDFLGAYELPGETKGQVYSGAALELFPRLKEIPDKARL
ncbi:Amidohydrolase 2 [Penicillium mononematosum]|uniref:Amidohydrolase 2 n=1 Tax=Penicillium mononematosum TaxID=268346 RepID=UPI002548E032|nr:Amidohydrolase 2 [Penicillium mononematosum]KAJ6189153.1 Amidohydrolase 2 [Penicillium mononematosum]